jgi:hypothetical protein
MTKRIMNPASIQNLRRGRALGAKNRATVARELAASAAVAALVEKLTPDEIAALTPKEVLASAMIMLFRQGRLIEAANVAEKLAPFIHSRMSPAAGYVPIPEDLLPDPIPIGDEEGPPGGPILG